MAQFFASIAANHSLQPTVIPHAFFTRLMNEGGVMLWGRVTYEMMESYWPAVARGDVEVTPAVHGRSRY